MADGEETFEDVVDKVAQLPRSSTMCLDLLIGVLSWDEFIQLRKLKYRRIKTLPPL